MLYTQLGVYCVVYILINKKFTNGTPRIKISRRKRVIIAEPAAHAHEAHLTI